jgi:hypothetical protein
MNGSCPGELLEKYFDGEVTEEEKNLVDGHLSRCQTCQDALRTMVDLSHLIKDPVDELDRKENFSRVWQRIERGIQPEEKLTWNESLRRWFEVRPMVRKRVWIPAAAVIVAVILSITPFLFKKAPSSSDLSVVEYVESQSHNVMVYELEKGDVTVIWLLEGAEKEDPSKS